MSAGSVYALVHALGQTLEPFGVHIAPHLAPTNLLVTACVGVCLTFVIMVCAAWRVSATELMAGVRGEAGSLGKTVLIGGGVVMLVGAALVWARWHQAAGGYLCVRRLSCPARCP